MDQILRIPAYLEEAKYLAIYAVAVFVCFKLGSWLTKIDDDLARLVGKLIGGVACVGIALPVVLYLHLEPEEGAAAATVIGWAGMLMFGNRPKPSGVTFSTVDNIVWYMGMTPDKLKPKTKKGEGLRFFKRLLAGGLASYPAGYYTLIYTHKPLLALAAQIGAYLLVFIWSGNLFTLPEEPKGNSQ
jgi:hypothetical protein